MNPIRAIADLPFLRRDVLDLLNLRHHRDQPDPDYTGFGHARVDTIRLDAEGGEPCDVRDALLLAVHSTEEPEELAGDIELEFFVPEVGEDYSVTVLLSVFLRVWLPLLRSDERAIVLVVCNPNRTLLPATTAAGQTPLYYPLGDVASWLDVADGRKYLRLHAGSWRRAEKENG
ncbi:MAG: hypothetical protein EXR72_24305 [Myxococcales bacterium]|nr:hypothetical protein [Myxococcales bacterium]